MQAAAGTGTQPESIQEGNDAKTAPGVGPTAQLEGSDGSDGVVARV